MMNMTVQTDAFRRGFNQASLAPLDAVYKPLEKTRDQILLEEKSGYKLNDGRFKGNPDEEDELKKIKENREKAVSRSFSFSTQNIISGIADSLRFDNALLSMETGFYREVKDDQLLKDSNGKVVQTLEEKRAIEEKGRNCSAHFAQDETTMDEHTGKRITTKDYLGNMRIRENMEYKMTIRAKLDSGEMKPEDVPESLRKELKDKSYANGALEPTFLDRLKANYGGLMPTPIAPEISAPITDTMRPMQTSVFAPSPY